ncbi:PREDICTED: testis-expressed sequence 13A protein [Dipodomys ordii]|uniref:Testis-expressed sequence 13A protein n=1 Tax=Dipodomys ordii TaxID=10020 RepID=A0A1S3FZ17_DIPOR|nr:PREDICTED: testis-expressed sequence 13A protein [Dipodomys ordii]
MAMIPDDPTNGFHHDNVLAFINEQMARHPKGPEFYLENLSLSWEEIEDKFRAILEDRTVPREVQEACAWSSLALGVRFARRQSYLQEHRVQWLHEFARLHKSAANALASDLKQLSEQQETERREAAFQLRVIRTKLADVQKERDMLKRKLLQAELKALPIAEGPSLPTNVIMATASAATTAGGAGTEMQGVSDKEDVADMEISTTDVGGSKEEMDSATSEVPQAGEGTLMKLLGAMEWKNYPFGGQREGNIRAPEKANFSHSGTPNTRRTASPEPLTVQLPASFTYSYESPFQVSPSTPPIMGIAPLTPVPSYFMTPDISLISDMGITGADFDELQDRKDSDTQQERKLPIFRRPGDWDCPWCKAVNFSRRENCFRCGRGIWLQSP